MSIVVLKGCAGLGNRLATLAYFIEFCLKHKRTLAVDWRDGQFSPKGVNAFDRHFELRGIETTEIEDVNIGGVTVNPPIWGETDLVGIYDLYHFCSPWSQLLKLRINRLPTRWAPLLSGFWQLKPKYREAGIFRQNSWSRLLDKNNMPLFSLQKFFPVVDVQIGADFIPRFFGSTIRNHLTLRASFLQYAENVQRQLGLMNARSLGVHVRATDRTPDAGIEFLMEKIERALQSFQIDVIFLATDHREVEIQLKRKFHNVAVIDKLMPNTKGCGLHQWALQEGREHLTSHILDAALLELWLLSQCRYFLFQQQSTFSQMVRALATAQVWQEAWDS